MMANYPKPGETQVHHEGLPVAGYQPQPDNNVKIVNAFKELEERVLRLTDGLKANSEIDQRLLAIGVTQLQGAFMFINRSVFKPGRVSLPGDEK